MDIEGPLTAEGQEAAGEALQACVADITGLSGTVEQLHRHVRGPRSRRGLTPPATSAASARTSA